MSVPTLSETLTVSGTLSLSGHTFPDGSISADIDGGSFSIVPGSVSGKATLTIDAAADPASGRLTVDASGDGTITMVVTRSIPDAAWNAVLPGFIRITLPVRRDPESGVVAFSASNTRLGEIMPHTPYRITDFDDNGTREYTMDFAALITAFNARDAEADVNCDGAWTQADIDLWQAMFAEDADP